MPPSTAVRRALVLRCESVISRTIAVRGTGASGIHSPHRGTTPTASTSSLLRRFSLSSSPPQATGSPATKEVSRPKRPSPYRLLQPHAFLAAFASLHLAGWRLDVLRPGPASSQPPSDSSASDQLRKLPESLRDLQGRRLVTVFELPSGKHGWSTAQQLLHAIGESATKTNVRTNITSKKCAIDIFSIILPSPCVQSLTTCHLSPSSRL